MTDDYDGPERRATDNRFAAAMADVRDLRIGVADLAEAVAVRTAEFKGVVRQVAILLASLLVILMTFSLFQVARLNDRLDHGHDTITCLLLTDPSARTAQSLIECQKGH